MSCFHQAKKGGIGPERSAKEALARARLIAVNADG